MISHRLEITTRFLAIGEIAPHNLRRISSLFHPTDR
jgi:hypothetical protein